MPYHLYIFRHGQTDWNLNKKIQGSTDIPLNDTGREQARELGENLKTVGLDIILSSTLSRAHETGQIVAKICGNIPLETNPALKEMSFGDAEGIFHSQYEELYADITAIRNDMSHPDCNTTCAPNGETKLEVFTRVTDYLAEALPRIKGNKVGISVHSDVIKSIFALGFQEKRRAQNGECLELMFDPISKTFTKLPEAA